jgi:hypothetical protein
MILTAPLNAAMFDNPRDKIGFLEVLTNVGGLSMFSEFDICPGEEALYKDTLWDDDIGDSVLTHLGGLSLFMELPMNTLKEPEVSAETSISLGHAARISGDATHDPKFLLPYATTSVKLSWTWDPRKQDVIYIGPSGYIRLMSQSGY